jgi:hypothetical protein
MKLLRTPRARAGPGACGGRGDGVLTETDPGSTGTPVCGRAAAVCRRDIEQPTAVLTHVGLRDVIGQGAVSTCAGGLARRVCQQEALVVVLLWLWH